MSALKESALARAKLQTEAPVPKDQDRLRAAGEQAAALIEEAKGLSRATSQELLDRSVDNVSRSYYQYLMRRRHRGHRPPGGGA
jgi:hypothetical protein